MSSRENLTGRWVGHYDQRGKEYPVSADLVQDGVNLAGSMRDGQPDRDCSLFEATVEAGLPPGADEQIDANLRALIPDAPSTAIRSLSHLPPDSQIAGRCEGRLVSFVKSYIGTTFSGFKVGDKIVGMESEGHAVQYQGKLSSDGLQVEGRWWIEADFKRGTHRSEGFFILRREVKAEQKGKDSQQPQPRAGRNSRWWKFW
jgi:hypothetical protein